VIAALAIMACGQQATAQEASGQYYGYPGKQAPMPSGQGQSGHGCYVEMWGCHVEVCPPPSCHNVNLPVPGLENPSCQNAYVIVTEAPPQQPQTITVFRNHYVPIRIVTKPTPVVPVNIVVKWREIHYLCDCPPGSSQCPHVPTGSPQQGSPQAGSPQASSADPKTAPTTAVVAAPAAPATPATPVASAAPATPAAPAVVPENPPAKRWVWLQKQGLFGFGYQRTDGLWVIDPASKRPTPPEGQTIVPASTTAVNATDTKVAGS
jgi:hypothetical protein